MSSNLKKHVGQLKSTGRRCVVVFMQLPDAKDKALIVEIDALQPRYEQILLEVVDSQEGQNDNTLANVMGRRSVPETGRSVLEEFHVAGLMRAEPVSNIIMMPRPNQPVPLADILAAMGDQNIPVVAEQAEQGLDKFNPAVANMKAQSEDERVQMARNFLFEAEMLDQEAAKKREQAYRYAPELRPQTPVQPSVTLEEVQAQTPTEVEQKSADA